MDITAKQGKDGDPITCSYDLPSSIDELVKKWGGDAIASYAVAGIKVDVQNVIRAGIAKGASQKDIQKSVDAFVPEVKKRGKSAAEKLVDKFNDLTDDERNAILAQLAT